LVEATPPYSMWKLEDVKKAIKVEKIPLPTPRPGQVLVKMERSPINPSDLGSLSGHYDPNKKSEYPITPGFEGCGTVVASGGGIMAWRLLGKKVAINGTSLWAEYAIADALTSLPVPDNLSWEQCAGAFVNPLTVLAFVEIAINEGHTAILHTAAASSLGKMLIRHAKRHNVKVICVVRREDQVKQCEAAGATLILNTADADFDEKLKEMTAKYNCRLAFDAVAGELTGQILAGMPEGSQVQVYGGLSGKASANISPTDLIFKKKSVVGFWLKDYIDHKYKLGLFFWMRELARLLNGDLSSDIGKQFSLKDTPEALCYYVANMSAGKVLINMTQ